MADSILEGIVEHIATCPLLQDGVFRVDALGDQAVEYTIETGIFDPVIKRYINGDEVRQYQFNFGSREYYSMDRIQNIQNSAFYEKFANWNRRSEPQRGLSESSGKLLCGEDRSAFQWVHV